MNSKEQDRYLLNKKKREQRRNNKENEMEIETDKDSLNSLYFSPSNKLK